MSPQPDMMDDLGKKVDEVIGKAVEPVDGVIGEIDDRIETLEREKKALLAHRERAERMKDAAKLRKRAGRPASRSRREREQQPVPA